MEAKDTVFSRKKTLNLGGKIFDLSVPIIMGILNITPDSFYSGSRFKELDDVAAKAKQMLEDGADIIDIGGYSSRPNAENINENEEKSRILPVIEHLVKTFPEIKISVDTFRSDVAKEAVNAGACLVNDISGGNLDEKMFETIGKLKIPYVLMHMRGDPSNMANLTNYENILKEIFGYFEEKIYLLRGFGISDIIIDLGFGFAKTINQNYALLNHLEYFDMLEVPMLVGISRKSMIYRKLDTTAVDSLNGTTVLNTVALMKGANILRVHDVKQAVEAVKITNWLKTSTF